MNHKEERIEEIRERLDQIEDELAGYLQQRTDIEADIRDTEHEQTRLEEELEGLYREYN